MPSVFTRIMLGELPGRFVHQDETCVAILSIQPLRPGHALVIPRAEVDDWLDLPDETRRHLFDVAAKVGKAIRKAFQPVKVGVIIAGLEVRHAHIHLSPIFELHDLNFERANKSPDPAMLDDAAARVRAALE